MELVCQGLLTHGTRCASASLQLSPKEADIHLCFRGDEIKNSPQILKEILRSQNPNSYFVSSKKIM